jgi:hypothetical protein
LNTPRSVVKGEGVTIREKGSDKRGFILSGVAGVFVFWALLFGVRSTPFLPISDPFNGALKRLTQKANS